MPLVQRRYVASVAFQSRNMGWICRKFHSMKYRNLHAPASRARAGAECQRLRPRASPKGRLDSSRDRDARRVNNPVEMLVRQRISAYIRFEHLSPISKRAHKHGVCNSEIIQHANLARFVEDLLIEMIKIARKYRPRNPPPPAIKIRLPESVSTSSKARNNFD